MSEETQTDQTDKEQNFQALREKLEATEAKLAELRPAAINETIRGVGLDPNEGNGLVLKDLLGDDASEEKAKELVAKYGWEISEKTPVLTANERAAQEFANRQSALNQVTTSDEPQTFDSSIAELNDLIAVAKAAGNHSEVRRLNTQLISMNNRLLAQQMAAKARG